MRICIAVLALLLSWGSLCTPASAQREHATDKQLVGAGVAMAIPAYFLGVTWHEGTHAVLAKLFGATVTEFRVLPGFNKRNGKFYFGWVSYRGLLSREQKSWFLIGPKLTDLVVLGGYAALYVGNSLPRNQYGSLALGVLGAAAWVDFSKDAFSRNSGNDTVRFYNLRNRRSEWARLPYRLLHLGLSAATGYVMYQGLRQSFDPEHNADANAARIMPIFRLRY